MRFINIEDLRPLIRELIPGLAAATAEVNAAADTATRKALIEKHRGKWVACRQALSQLSAGKCWYMECKTPGADDDVDHYRPKNAVTEDETHPGYYWEAFNWRNFRLSCQRANRPKKGTDGATTLGKAAHFPLWAQSVRAMNPAADLLAERPLVLDPTNPLDPLILTFKPNGEVDLSPEFKNDVFHEAKFAASVLALHFNWPGFTDERSGIYSLVERAVDRGSRHAPASFPEFVNASQDFKECISELVKLMDKESEYSSAARIYVQSFRHVWWVDGIVLKLAA
jgi:hypothetical protein